MADHHTTQERAFQVRVEVLADHHTTQDRVFQVRAEVMVGSSHNT